MSDYEILVEPRKTTTSVTTDTSWKERLQALSPVLLSTIWSEAFYPTATSTETMIAAASHSTSASSVSSSSFPPEGSTDLFTTACSRSKVQLQANQHQLVKGSTTTSSPNCQTWSPNPPASVTLSTISSRTNIFKAL